MSAMAGADAQTVLVVEDEASIASFVAMYLRNAGYEVQVAPNGGAGVTPSLMISRSLSVSSGRCVG